MGNLPCSDSRKLVKEPLCSIESTEIRKCFIKINKRINQYKFRVKCNFPLYKIYTLSESKFNVPDFKLIINNKYQMDDIVVNLSPVSSRRSMNGILNINKSSFDFRFIDKLNSNCPVQLDDKQRKNSIYFFEYDTFIEFDYVPKGNFKLIIEGYDKLRTKMYPSHVDKEWINYDDFNYGSSNFENNCCSFKRNVKILNEEPDENTYNNDSNIRKAFKCSIIPLFNDTIYDPIHDINVIEI